jgi:predicted RNA binding protein YcfA (HicA-like mRNA interferase family)
MPKRLGSTEVIRVLQQHGFFFVSQKGSHAKYKNADGRIAIVPHPKKELGAALALRYRTIDFPAAFLAPHSAFRTLHWKGA